MLSPSEGLEEYLFTIGILISFVGTLAAAYISRKSIASALKEAGLDKRKLAVAIILVLLFVSIELVFVKPTQQLFFDDSIYQGMAQDLLHMGQAWMCSYGTPTKCFIGEIFHEPIGTSFNLAIAFAIFGVSSNAAYGTGFFLAAVSVIFVFFVALLMSKKFIVAAFAELFMALSPALLIWAEPTTSDMPMLAYSLIAIFFMLIFVRKRNYGTFALALLSLALLSYMKVDAVVYLVLIPVMYVVLSDDNILSSLKNNFMRLRKGLLDTKLLVIFMIFIIAIGPEIGFAYNELTSGSFGYSGAYVQQTCLANLPAIIASRPIDLQNFEANLCSNVAFWTNAYADIDIIQPLAFTVFAAIGVAFMLGYKKFRELLTIALWFFAFFLLYTSFYAGGVLYGVDWRFMLSLVAQTSILGGFGAYGLIEIARVISSGGKR